MAKMCIFITLTCPNMDLHCLLGTICQNRKNYLGTSNIRKKDKMLEIACIRILCQNDYKYAERCLFPEQGIYSEFFSFYSDVRKTLVLSCQQF